VTIIPTATYEKQTYFKFIAINFTEKNFQQFAGLVKMTIFAVALQF